MYDKNGQTNFDTDQNFQNSQNYSQYNQYNQSNDFSDFFTQSDIFSKLFGEGFGQQNFQQSTRNTIYQVDYFYIFIKLQSELQISFLESVLGTKTSVSLNMNETCTRCLGKRSDPNPGSIQKCKICKGSGYVFIFETFYKFVEH